MEPVTIKATDANSLEDIDKKLANVSKDDKVDKNDKVNKINKDNKSGNK